MKSLFCLLLVPAMLAAAEPAFPNRDLKPGAAGLTVGPTARYDESVGAFAVTRGDNDTAVVFTDEQPGVGGNSFQLHGEVKYEGVGDKGYLEMLTRVGGAKLSSQTQGDQTVMTKIMGSWRNFILRVTLAGSNVPAKQVELNAVLPEASQGLGEGHAIPEDGSDGWPHALQTQPSILRDVLEAQRGAAGATLRTLGRRGDLEGGTHASPGART